jgi:uncharacterized membrane protein
MEKQSVKTMALGIVMALFILLNSIPSNSSGINDGQFMALNAPDHLKQAAFKILEAKCNSCHRKRNPFMVFSLNNMEKRATKINQQVFITKRMPKGDQVKLTKNEQVILKNWLKNIR